MDRLIVPGVSFPVLRMSWPGDPALVVPSQREAVLAVSAIEEARLVLPGPIEAVLVLPASLVPKVPGRAQGTVAVVLSVTGEVTMVYANASGGVSAAATVTGSARAKANAVGGPAVGVTVSGAVKPLLAGSVSFAASVSGVSVPKLAGALSVAASVSGVAVPKLNGSLLPTVSVAGQVTAKAYGVGSLLPVVTVTGEAVRVFVPMGMYCTTTARYEDGNSTWAQITNMAALPAYGGTVLSGNGLKLLTPAPTLLTAKCTWAGLGSDVAIYINGVKVKDSASLPNATSDTITHTYTAAVNDVVTVWNNPYNNSLGNRPVQSGQTNTFLTANPA